MSHDKLTSDCMTKAERDYVMGTLDMLDKGRSVGLKRLEATIYLAMSEVLALEYRCRQYCNYDEVGQ